MPTLEMRQHESSVEDDKRALRFLLEVS